ncbi:4-phosphoerythronate dehydrogenase [bacterium endosymbiont of Pedicinus badii]|uniref:4-phosphoerythronate dehydrogenase n=1 Tax=bacterium endosymbiont of Pedicinus badii TaxID=1719126 RepID=UPI0009C6D9AD|nr:4-phosphoerythronate dehydrogenase [bacterium endosymbiont of Pedicinus badii]OQM34465.1 hypothetical protein AOQ89_01070 [bacterium endosymbiont of Pedicinus badii]
MNILIDENVYFGKNIFSSVGKVNIIKKRIFKKFVLSHSDALIIRSSIKIRKNSLQNTKVKFVGSATSGIDHVDTKYLKNSKIKFSFAKGCNSRSVVEYVISCMYFFAKKYNFFLKDKVVGIIGMGSIGSLLFKILKKMQINTIFYDPFVKNQKNCKNLKEVAKSADIITLHVPLTKHCKHSTWHLIDYNFLSSLKKNCILINTSRGAVVDNLGLLKILKEKKEIKVALDVWENEPKFSSSLFSLIDIGTPHIAGYSLEGRLNGTFLIYKKYCKFLKIKKKFDKILFPNKPIFRFKIPEKYSISEEKIGKIIRVFCNVEKYSLFFRNNAKEDFFKIRNKYTNRREFSSIKIDTKNFRYKQQLSNLGFS